MTFRRPRTTTVATYRGRIYRSAHPTVDGMVRLAHDGPVPPQEEGFTKRSDIDIDVWVRMVRAEDCDRVVRVSTGATLGPYRCQVLNIAEDGMAELIRSHETPGWKMVEPGIYRKYAHVSELRDYHESHTDLLFNYWRDRTFGSGSQVRP